MAKRNRPSASGESQTVETGLQRMQREVQERAQRRREAREQEYENRWAEQRAALERGEISREELLGEHVSAPIRVTVGDTHFEISFAATVRDVPAPESKPAKPAAEVLPFPPKRRASPGKSRRKSGGNVGG
jgi:hypothetical protein